MAYNGLNEPVLLFVVGANGTLVPAAGLQPGYGPHNSLASARTVLTEIFKSISNVPQGYTFCVIENGTPVEYWFTRSGGWYIDRKCNGDSSSQSGSGDLSAFQMRITSSGVLKYTVNGTDWYDVGQVNLGNINDVQLKIDDTNGHLYISHNGEDGPWDDVGFVGAEGVATPHTRVRFTTAGALQASYDGGITWVDVEGSQYQGKKIDPYEFQTLLRRFLKFDLDENNFLTLSYDGGSTSIPIAKSCACQDQEDTSGLYRLKIRVIDSETQASVSGASITITDSSNTTTNGTTTQWVEPGTYTLDISCVGYLSERRIATVTNFDVEVVVPLRVDASVPQSFVTVIPVEEDGTTVIDASKVKIYIRASDGLLERSTAWVRSGETITIKIVGNSGSGYGTIEVNKRVESTTTYSISVPFASQEPESTWQYFIRKVKLQSNPYSNSGVTANTHINAYRTNTVTGENEPLTFVRVYNADGDSRVECAGTYNISPSDPEYLPYASIGIRVVYPEAEKQYLYSGYIYRMKADFEDRDGNQVTTSWSVCYEGFWEYYIEKYSQIDYPDSTDGGKAIIRVDSYCVADAECPDVDPVYRTRYACPISIESKTGVSISAGYPIVVYTGNGERGGQIYDREYNSSGAFVENYRNIIELTLTQDPHTIEGNTLVNGVFAIPIEITQSGTQHFPLFGDSFYMLSHSDDGYVSEDVYIDTCAHSLYFESGSIDVQALGEYSSRSSQAFWNGHGEFKHSLLTAYSGETQPGSSSDSFYGARVKVYDDGNSLVYEGTISPSGSIQESTDSDGYLTNVHIYRMWEAYDNASGTHTRLSNKIGIQMRHTMNYNSDREYTIEVSHDNSGKTISTTWTLLQASLSFGDGVYPHQSLPEAEGSVAYFGVYGDVEETDVKLEPLGYRSNWADTVLEKVSSIPSGWEVDPMHRDDNVNWFAQGDEPVRVPNENDITWFKITCPAIPNGPGDVEKTRRWIVVYYDDGSANAASNNTVFIGQQGNTY